MSSTTRNPTAVASPQPWDLAVGSGLVRLAAGTVLVRFAWPLSRFAGADRTDTVVPAVLTGFGVRDTALGVSALAASRPGRDVARQLKLQAGLDVVDAAVMGALIATGRVPRWRGTGGALLALGSAATELLAIRRLK